MARTSSPDRNDRELRGRHSEHQGCAALRHGRQAAAQDSGEGRRRRRAPALWPARLRQIGMTESCAAATLNTKDAQRFGTVGRPLPKTQVKADVDGELLLYGPHVFARSE